MKTKNTVSRRHFMGGAAAALGYLGLKPGAGLLADEPGRLYYPPWDDEYDALAKLGFNENPWGPSSSVFEAMTGAWKYANRYGYPDGDIHQVIADHHGVPRDHVLMGAGSGEILRVVGLAFLAPGKKVVGVEPSYGSVYSHASGLRAEAVTLPLMDDHRQSIPDLISTTNRNARNVGFVYLCNPNNPTGVTVTAAEVKDLLDSIPEDIPVLIDEAYHHFVQDPRYETSVPYVLEGRNVIIARTFSKIYGLAAMRLGYAIAPPALIDHMSPFSTGTINALVRWGGVAALKDKQAEERVRRDTIELRGKLAAQLEGWGHEVIPSETNFIMVHTGRHARDLGTAFREHGIHVGRPFPPMEQYLRVSVGTEEEIGRLLDAWPKVFA